MKSKATKTGKKNPATLYAAFKDVLLPLEISEREALHKSLKEHGCLNEVLVWQGMIVDGHHRYAFCRENGIPFNTKELSFNNEDEAKDFISELHRGRRSLDLWKRYLMTIPKRKAIEEKAKENQRKKSSFDTKIKSEKPVNTRKEVALEMGTSEGTIQKLDFVYEHGNPLEIEKLRKGKRTLNQIYIKTKAEQDRKKTRINTIATIEKFEAENGVIPNLQLFHSPFENTQIEIPAGTVDLVLTDPPYEGAWVKNHADLADFANHILRPGGSLVFMVGNDFLREVLNVMDGHGLKYHTMITQTYDQLDKVARYHQKRFDVFCKHLLWFVKGAYKGNIVRNCVSGGRCEKNLYEWQQGLGVKGESGMYKLVEMFSQPGDLVCDPMCGSGTTGVAVLNSNRKFIGMEKDADRFELTKARIIRECAGIEADNVVPLETTSVKQRRSA